MIGRGERGRPLSDINVTPFVDVMLVLLVIFMVTAPFLEGGLEIDLPKVSSRGLDVRDGLVVSVQRSGAVSIGDRVVASASLERALASAGATSRPVFLKADRGVPYGTVVELIARLRRAGVTSLGLVTEPPAGRERRR